jgi:hypothetical protein
VTDKREWEVSVRRQNKRKINREEQHTHLAIRVGRYDACVRASVNHNVYAPQYAWNLDDTDPLYEFTNEVTITGVATSPPERAGATYELTMYGNDTPSHRLNLELKDVQERDEHGSPKYRQYRGKEIPIYLAPKGLGLLDKVRGEAHWTAWLFVSPRLVADAVMLLGQQKNLFLAVHERKVERSRWVQGVSLQTNDPAEE